MIQSEHPPRRLTPAEIEAFRRDGAICIRQLYSAKWLKIMTDGIEQASVDAVTPETSALEFVAGSHLSSPTAQRRAITTRWCGDDVVYFPKGKQMPVPWQFSLASGDPLSGPIFPQVLPRILESEVGARMRGPIFPDPKKAMEASQQMAAAERVAVF